MKYLKKFESNTDHGLEDIISKIKEQFKKEDIIKKIDSEEDDLDEETAVLDMICWYEDTYDKTIPDEDLLISMIEKEYNLK